MEEQSMPDGSGGSASGAAVLASHDAGVWRVLAAEVAGGGRGDRVLVSVNAKDHHVGRRGAKELWVHQQLDGVGLEPVALDLRDVGAAGLARELRDAAAVWLAGGNAFWLAHLCERDGLAEALGEAHGEGLVLGGESAGAVVWGTSVETVRAMDDPDVVVATPRTLGAVPYAVWPHAGEAGYRGPSPAVLARLEAAGGVLRLGADEVVVVRGGDVEVVAGDTDA